MSTHLDVWDITLWLKDKLYKFDFEVFVMRTWAIWSERLRLIHHREEHHHIIRVKWCEGLLNDFQIARQAVKIAANHNIGCSPVSWIAPPMGSLRLDVDAAYNESSNSCAIGGVIRNHDGQQILVFGKSLEKPPSILYAELLAIEGGLKISRDHNIRIHQINSDSLLAVQAVMAVEDNISYDGALASDIKRLLSSQSSNSLMHVRRSANHIADSIATFACSSPSPFVWRSGNFPFWLIDLVIKDFTTSQ